MYQKLPDNQTHSPSRLYNSSQHEILGEKWSLYQIVIVMGGGGVTDLLIIR